MRKEILMSEMFEKSLRTLELPAVLEMLSHRAVPCQVKFIGCTGIMDLFGKRNQAKE